MQLRFFKVKTLLNNAFNVCHAAGWRACSSKWPVTSKMCLPDTKRLKLLSYNPFHFLVIIPFISFICRWRVKQLACVKSCIEQQQTKKTLKEASYEGPVSQRVAFTQKSFLDTQIFHWARIDITCTMNRNPLWNGPQKLVLQLHDVLSNFCYFLNLQ